jgi:hypothetical protein
MPTRNVSLTRLQRQRRQDALKVKTLLMRITAGVDALERGDFTEVADAALDKYLEGFTAPLAKGSR